MPLTSYEGAKNSGNNNVTPMLALGNDRKHLVCIFYSYCHCFVSHYVQLHYEIAI